MWRICGRVALGGRSPAGELSRAAQHADDHTLADAQPSYVTGAGIAEDRKGWLFCTSRAHTAAMLPERPMIQPNARPRSANTPWTPAFMRRIGNHSVRATGITAYLDNGGALEHGQKMAAHVSPRATKRYHRSKELSTQDEAERIRP
jgi:hypothetical protein